MAKWNLPTVSSNEQRLDKIESLFRYSHLPEHLQAVSKPFYDLAVQLTETLPSSPEYTLAYRALWEAKNLAVFAALEAAEGDS